MTAVARGSRMPAEFVAGLTNLLLSVPAFAATWTLGRLVRFGPLSPESMTALALTLIFFLPQSVVVVYLAWRLASTRLFSMGAPSTRHHRGMWAPGLAIGGCLGILHATTGVLGVWAPVIRRFWEGV